MSKFSKFRFIWAFMTVCFLVPAFGSYATEIENTGFLNVSFASSDTVMDESYVSDQNQGSGTVLSDLPLSEASLESILESYAIAERAASNTQAETTSESSQSLKQSDQTASQTTNIDITSSINYSLTEKGGQTIYVFEGKEYTLGVSYGVHKLSGYSAAENGNARTTSGEIAMPRHTLAASSELPLGTVLIITGVSGPQKDLYNGMYVVEDRGGHYVENEGWLDIFFNTYEEALNITNYGWNYAEAYIAIPLS